MDKLISTYFKNYNRLIDGKSQEDTIWASEKIDLLVRELPLEGLDIVIQLINESENDKILAFVAAGPLEDLLSFNGDKILENLIEIADNNEKVQYALTGVWLDENEDKFYPLWWKLMQRYGFTGDNPKQGL